MIRSIPLFILLLLATNVVADELPLTRRLKFQVCYVRESVDVAWHISIVGTLPRPPGVFVIVYNEAGDMVHRGEVPDGVHSEKSPFTLTVPADGKAQQYVIKIIGQQDNYCDIALPLTDLPGEVYGNTSYVMCYRLDRPDLQRQIAFQVPAGGEKVQFSGGGAHVQILDDARQPVADSRKTGTKEAPYQVNATLQPGRVYWLDLSVGNALYFNAGTESVYLTFDPGRWFKPDLKWDLETRPWWKGVRR